MKKQSKEPLTQRELASLGGKATMKKLGRKHFQQMAKRRWAIASKKKGS